MHDSRRGLMTAALPAVAVVSLLLCAACRTSSEEEKQVYALAYDSAREIYATGTAQGSSEAAIVKEAARLAATSAGAPARPIAKEQFAEVLPHAERNVESGFWATPLGEVADVALLSLGLGGIGQLLLLLRRKTRIFRTVVDAIEVFSKDYPDAAQELKSVIGEKAESVKGFNGAVDKAKQK